MFAARRGAWTMRRAGHSGVVVRERRGVAPAPFTARLLELGVRPGDAVTAGEELARFDAGSVERALDVVEAAVREAEAGARRQPSLARIAEEPVPDWNLHGRTDPTSPMPPSPEKNRERLRT